MRHILALLLAACLALAGCGSSPAPTATQRLVQPLAALMEQLCDHCQLPMPTSLDSELLDELMGIPPEQVVQFAGYISMNGDCPDQLVAVQATADAAEQVAKSLEARRALLLDAYADNPDALARVQAGQVVFRGSYVFMVIAGRQGQPPATETQLIVKMIEDNFEK